MNILIKKKSNQLTQEFRQNKLLAPLSSSVSVSYHAITIVNRHWYYLLLLHNTTINIPPDVD